MFARAQPCPAFTASSSTSSSAQRTGTLGAVAPCHPGCTSSRVRCTTARHPCKHIGRHPVGGGSGIGLALASGAPSSAMSHTSTASPGFPEPMACAWRMQLFAWHSRSAQITWGGPGMWEILADCVYSACRPSPLRSVDAICDSDRTTPSPRAQPGAPGTPHAAVERIACTPARSGVLKPRSARTRPGIQLESSSWRADAVPLRIWRLRVCAPLGQGGPEMPMARTHCGQRMRRPGQAEQHRGAAGHAMEVMCTGTARCRLSTVLISLSLTSAGTARCRRSGPEGMPRKRSLQWIGGDAPITCHIP